VGFRKIFQSENGFHGRKRSKGTGVSEESIEISGSTSDEYEDGFWDVAPLSLV
jgi:hypothetical protein